LIFFLYSISLSYIQSDYLKIKLFNHLNDDEEYINDERQCLIKMFAVSFKKNLINNLLSLILKLSCKSNREYRAFEICQLMDSIALQLAIRYATKSGKITLAQKITDELIEQKQDQEEKQKEIQRSVSPPPLPSYSSSTISILSTFEEIQQTRPTVSPSAGPFSNPFRKKALAKSVNETTTTDELSKWKPSVNKSRLSSTNKTAITIDGNNEMAIENEDSSLNGKRKIEEDEINEEEAGKPKRNKLRQFACNK
jgi:hypothetical protein